MSVRYPDVPIADGVPPVLRSRIAPITTAVSILTADGAGVADEAINQWGLFDTSGNPILKADSIEAIDIMGEATIADYPLEGGGFESYNKVQAPFRVDLAMTKTGTKAEKLAFLELLDSLVTSTELVDAVVPERSYMNATVVRYDVIRNAETGPQAMRVTVSLQEVRLRAQVRFLNEKSPNASTTESGGSVQTRTPPVTAGAPT